MPSIPLYVSPGPPDLVIEANQTDHKGPWIPGHPGHVVTACGIVNLPFHPNCMCIFVHTCTYMPVAVHRSWATICRNNLLSAHEVALREFPFPLDPGSRDRQASISTITFQISYPGWKKGEVGEGVSSYRG